MVQKTKRAKMIASVVLILLGIALMGLLVGCVSAGGGGDGGGQEMRSLRVKGESLLQVGQSAQYVCEVTPQGSLAGVEWSVVDEEFGQINANGIFVAKKDGVAYIVAKAEGVSSDPYKVVIDSQYDFGEPFRTETASAITDNVPQILGKYTDGYSNYYLLNAGYILGQYVGNMGFVNYNGQTPVTSTVTTVTATTYTETLTDTVSDSVMMNTSAGLKVGWKAGVEAEAGFGGFKLKAKAELSEELSINTSLTNTVNHTLTTNTSEMTSKSESVAIEFTVGEHGEKRGYYRYALYSNAVDVMMQVRTSRDNQTLLDIETYAIASTKSADLIPHFEYSQTPFFDNTPLGSTLDVDYNFYQRLEIPDESMDSSKFTTYHRIPASNEWRENTRLDLSGVNNFPTGVIGIPTLTNQIWLVGARGKLFEDLQLFVEPRGADNAIKIIVEDWEMQGTPGTGSAGNVTINAQGSPLTILENLGHSRIYGLDRDGGFANAIWAQDLTIAGGDSVLDIGVHTDFGSGKPQNGGADAIKSTGRVSVVSRSELFALTIVGGKGKDGLPGKPGADGVGAPGGNAINADFTVQIIGMGGKIHIEGGKGGNAYPTNPQPGIYAPTTAGSGGYGILSRQLVSILANATIVGGQGGQGMSSADGTVSSKGGKGGDGVKGKEIVLDYDMLIVGGDGGESMDVGGSGGNGVVYGSLLSMGGQYNIDLRGGKAGYGPNNGATVVDGVGSIKQ
ncbi:MAG: hypothetical protein FWD76_00320 [Firmicutes bacterium]|nr:hypothetical protein [Bacillota bacterium]